MVFFLGENKISIALYSKKGKPVEMNQRAFFSWYLQESNQGHMDFQSIALPTELRYQPFLLYPVGLSGRKSNIIF